MVPIRRGKLVLMAGCVALCDGDRRGEMPAIEPFSQNSENDLRCRRWFQGPVEDRPKKVARGPYSYTQH